MPDTSSESDTARLREYAKSDGIRRFVDVGPLMVRAADTIDQQAARIAKLEAAMRKALGLDYDEPLRARCILARALESNQ